MKQTIQSNQTSDIFLQLISRLYQKKDDLLQSTNRIIELSDNADDKNWSQQFTEIKKELNIILESISELAPHSPNSENIAKLKLTAGELLLLGEAANINSSKLKGAHVYKSKLELQLYCQLVNTITIRPTKKSIEMALGMKMNLKPLQLEGLVRTVQANH